MSWWQKKVLGYGLRYGLSKTGLLEDKAIDIDNLDITIGKTNVIDLKDVGLNIKRITKLAQLPPCLRLETARVLSLRLTIPADFYQSSIVVEVDGVEIVAHLEEEAVSNQQHGKQRARSPNTARAPQHRKTNRRIPSPPPYDPGGLSDSEEELHIPTTQEVAKSFLKEEPVKEREELEAVVAASAGGVEESFVSESSASDDVGTGVGIGVPGFLSGFLQGLVDRIKVEVRNVHLKIETEIQNEVRDSVPVALELNVGGATVDKVQSTEVGLVVHQKRTVSLQDISLDILSDDTFLAELSDLPSQTSRTDSKSPGRSPASDLGAFDAIQASMRPTASTLTDRSYSSTSSRSPSHAMSPSLPLPPPASSLKDSTATMDADRFADARSDDNAADHGDPSFSALDIRPGDDNISWGSRRSNTSAPAEDLWKSMASEEDLPESLLIHPEPTAHSSRGTSPFASRLRRPVSPYDRTLQSPGSWPRFDESPQRHRLQTGPGSWPNLEQSQHRVYEPLAQVLASSSHEITDNKRDALEQSRANAEQLQIPPGRQDSPSDEMLESRVFSHEEAQSMYMSAMTGSPQMKMPGGWASDVQSERSDSPDAARKPVPEDITKLDGNISSKDTTTSNLPSGNATPRAQTPAFADPPAAAGGPSQSMASRELLFLDRVSISTPTGQQPVDEGPAVAPNDPRAKSSHFGFGTPGAFSAYAEMSGSRRRGTNSVYTTSQSVLFPSREELSTSNAEDSVEVSLGTLSAQIDIPTGRLLHALSTKAAAAVEASLKAKPSSKSDTTTKTNPECSIQVSRLQILMFERLDHPAKLKDLPLDRHGTIDIVVDHIVFRQAEATSLHTQTLKILMGGADFLCVEPGNVSASQVNSKDESAISVRVSKNRFDIKKRAVTEAHLQTAQIQLAIDLALIDDTFGSFGGLSGMVELGSSVMSESGTNSPVASKPPSRGVRFAGEAETPSSDPEIKLNGRLGGVVVHLRGPRCSLMAKTGTVKAIYREGGLRTTVDHILLQGPFIDDHTSSPATIDLAGIRVEYLNQPVDTDLERLLSLLTPSRDKYDNDEDILLDTLLRQRRKGALLRLMADDTKIRIDNWGFVSTLSALEKDLNKLSAVAKYLPEDERPGLLTLVRLGTIEARLPVNERFGQAQIFVKVLQLAHVGVPPLLALSIGSVDASQLGGPTLIHPFVPLAGADNLPVIMARMLGDDAIKVKLFNLALEYSVPVILDLTSMDEEKEPTEIAAHLAQSVANLALNEAVPSSTATAKKMQIDILVHDSAIGLTPQKLLSKAILVLSDAQLSTAVPPSDSMVVNLELRQASLFITEQVVEGPVDPASRGPVPIDQSSNVAKALTERNFVSIGTMRAAKVKFEAKEDDDEVTSKTIEVGVSVNLLLLETCADSTQTLFATLGALAPPTPPSKEPKYLTEPMQIEDLMKSFTGEPLAVPQEDHRPPSVLYDADNPLVDDDPQSPSMSIAASTLDEDLYHSQMAGSLYGPGSGIFGMDADAENESTIGEDYPETAESLLEEDPFEMAEAPVARMGDAALVRDLSRQCKPALSEEPVDLGLYEIEDLGYDALSGQQALGDGNRFNAPYIGDRSQKGKAPPKVPFRLKLRDSNIMWHLHDGYDWQRTRDGIAEVVEQVEQKAEERRARRRQSRQDPDDDGSVIGDVLFNSIYIGIPGDHDAEELRRRINHTINEDVSETASVPASALSRPSTTYSGAGQPTRRQRKRLKLGRGTSHKLSFELKGMAVDVVVLPPGGEVVSSLDIRLQDFEIYDRMPSSTWRKFLTHRDEPSMREMSKPMFHIKLDNVRTIRSHAATDIMLHVTALPLRLHVDQDAEQFMLRFFAFKDETVPESEASEEDKPYISRIEVEDVELRLDYKPKNLDWMALRAGKTSELMNVVTLEGANILLRHAIVHGVGGFDQLHPKLDGLWTPDVINNQLPRVISGVAAFRNVVNVGVGLSEVVTIPIKEYKKDGRLVRSIQKGAYHFGKTTTSELARLGAKVALGTQTFLSNAEEFLNPTEPSSSRPGAGSRRISSQDNWHDISDTEETEKPAVSAYASQPVGLMSGLRSARKYLEHDLLTARDALIAVQGEFLESRTPGSAAGAVARHAPTVILRPVIGASRAVGTTLLGVGNAVDRDNLRRVEDKYKHR
ncbi:hypothetical protein M409DRAFT_20679 [Zasmidium cellare ATCC 36951]|uniref:Autophagy-related protein 2 n=1 Tax=Zasmidium cellare ATCC 36951 TaxID=1080233 RepID=A0A6A6CQW2_ZASCE|nr:uncharacterized protein M409DRAFT_20679 [Zasmidium cellare ATCC 36951]KAF2169461.1 hypothetical protein M409DRAFT_20679 [Zasmidium cellare ATCC 36951]